MTQRIRSLTSFGFAGQIRHKRPFSIGLIIDYIWALLNAIYLL